MPKGEHRADLPPGQTATRRFPLVGEAAPAEGIRPEDWRLVVAGLVRRPGELSFDDLLALPSERVVRDLHCVTGWSRSGLVFEGPRLDAVLDASDVLPEARFVRFVAHSPRGHDTSLPLDAARREAWLVHTLDGAPLPVAHGGPARVLVPSRYLYKSLKWLARIELLAEDRPGTWEREAGYHNEADPWREQRFVTGDLKPDDVHRFRRARRYAPFRGKNLLGVDLAGWAPEDKDLRELLIRASDLSGANLRGTDLRASNLSSSNLRGADLGGADLRGADLEGADLRGADLRDADLRGARLTATRLADPGTRVEGLRWEAGAGWLEEDERFLLERGIQPAP